CIRVQSDLGVAPVGTTEDPRAVALVVIGAGTRRGCPRGIEVRDLLRSSRVSNVEDADAGIEIAARKRRRVMTVVDTAIVTAIRKAGQSSQVGKHLGAVGRVVRLEHQPRYELRVRFVGDVYDARHVEHRQPCGARSLVSGHAVAASAAFFYRYQIT